MKPISIVEIKIRPIYRLLAKVILFQFGVFMERENKHLSGYKWIFRKATLDAKITQNSDV